MFNKNINKSIDSYLNSDYSKFKKYERINFLINEISRNIDPKKNYELLDIGCSKGELIYILKDKFSNINFTGLEYSNELLKIAKNEPFLKDVSFINGDARNFDIKKKFDAIESIGVIHHLQNPKKAIENLFKCLKKDGTLIIWAYAKEGNENYIRLLNFLRFFTKRLPLRIVRIVAKIFSIFLWIFLKIVAGNNYLKMIKKFSLKHLEAIIFDQLFPSIANYWTKEEMVELIRPLHIKSYELNHTNNYSWTLICKKE